MTLIQFEETAWKAEMTAKYLGKEYDVVSVNLKEAIVGLAEKQSDDDDPMWVRCENIELINPER